MGCATGEQVVLEFALVYLLLQQEVLTEFLSLVVLEETDVIAAVSPNGSSIAIELPTHEVTLENVVLVIDLAANTVWSTSCVKLAVVHIMTIWCLN